MSFKVRSVVESIGDMEVVIRWISDGVGGHTVSLTANVQTLDVGNNELGRQYIRGHTEVVAIFTAAQLGSLNAMGALLRAEAITKLVS